MIDWHNVFSCDCAGFSQKTGIDIETPGRLTERPGNDFLSLAAQQPIDENLGAVRMRRRFDDRQIAAATGAVISLFECRKSLDRQSGFEKRKIRVIGETDHHGDSSFGQTFRELALIAAEI